MLRAVSLGACRCGCSGRLSSTSRCRRSFVLIGSASASSGCRDQFLQQRFGACRDELAVVDARVVRAGPVDTRRAAEFLENEHAGGVVPWHQAEGNGEIGFAQRYDAVFLAGTAQRPELPGSGERRDQFGPIRGWIEVEIDEATGIVEAARRLRAEPVCRLAGALIPSALAFMGCHPIVDDRIIEQAEHGAAVPG